MCERIVNIVTGRTRVWLSRSARDSVLKVSPVARPSPAGAGRSRRPGFQRPRPSRDDGAERALSGRRPHPVDRRTRQTRRVQVTTVFHGDQVDLTATFKTLKSGLTYMAFGEAIVPAKELS